MGIAGQLAAFVKQITQILKSYQRFCICMYVHFESASLQRSSLRKLSHASGRWPWKHEPRRCGHSCLLVCFCSPPALREELIPGTPEIRKPKGWKIAETGSDWRGWRRDVAKCFSHSLLESSGSCSHIFSLCFCPFHTFPQHMIKDDTDKGWQRMIKDDKSDFQVSPEVQPTNKHWESDRLTQSFVLHHGLPGRWHCSDLLGQQGSSAFAWP